MCKFKISQWRVCVCVNFGNVRLVLMFFPFLTSNPRYIGWLIGIFILFLTSGRPSSGRQCNGMHHQRVRRRHKSRHIFPHFLSSSSRGKDTLVSSNSLFLLLFLYLKLTNTSVNRPASTLHAPHTQTHLLFQKPFGKRTQLYIIHKKFQIMTSQPNFLKEVEKEIGLALDGFIWKGRGSTLMRGQNEMITMTGVFVCLLLFSQIFANPRWSLNTGVQAQPFSQCRRHARFPGSTPTHLSFPAPPLSPFKEAAHFRDPPSLSSILTAPPAPARSSVLWQLLHLDRGTAMATLCNPHGTSPEKTRVALWSKGGWRQSGRPLAPLCTWRQRAQLTFTLVIAENKDS